MKLESLRSKQQATSYHKGNRNKLGLRRKMENRNRNDLGLQCGKSLSGDFLRLLQNQNFTGRPKVMKSKNSTINPWKKKAKIMLADSVRSDMIATITISRFFAAVPIEPIQKRVLLNIFGLI